MSEEIDIRIVEGPVAYIEPEPFPQPAGAECAFLGHTRNEMHPEHGRLLRLRYEAYQPMAEAVLRRLADEARRRFECLLVRVHHSIGEVPPGEPSVLVQVVAGHRNEAFEACRFLIDRLKVEAPIWKKELWEHDATWSKGAPVEIVESAQEGRP